MNHKEVLEKLYDEALSHQEGRTLDFGLSAETEDNVRTIVSNSEKSKGLVAVLTTLLTHKIVCPEQDIRYHQAQLEGGFSGRTIDTEHITPFLKSVSFPSMSSTGWMTRSFEQAAPYMLDYQGSITPRVSKSAFLHIIDRVQVCGERPEAVLLLLFSLLIKQRDGLYVELAKPHTLTIAAIIGLLEKHFNYKYTCAGASRLPMLAIYAAYQCMADQVARYNGKNLCPLESHNSADTRSGRIGDIEVDDPDGNAFEGVEIKHGIPITRQLVEDAYEKFKGHSTERYYLLTTANMDSSDIGSINEEIERIGRTHGCQVIVNGVYSSLRYYLRLLTDPAEFIDRYVELMKVDKTVKFQHKMAWNEVVSRGI